MESKTHIEIALRSAMLASDILELLKAKDRIVLNLIIAKAQRDFDELKKIVANSN